MIRLCPSTVSAGGILALWEPLMLLWHGLHITSGLFDLECLFVSKSLSPPSLISTLPGDEPVE